MSKKADLDQGCPDAGSRACRKCLESTECDWCDRRLCYFVHVEWAENPQDLEESICICRPCAREMGFSEEEIAERGFVSEDGEVLKKWEEST